MLLGVKARWRDSLARDVILLSSRDVELLESRFDLSGDYREQLRLLEGFKGRVFHIHAPVRADFVHDPEVFINCVRLGDLLNSGSYHLVCHCRSRDFTLIGALINRLLGLSRKVVLCFENLGSGDSFINCVDFIGLFDRVSDSRVGVCLDVRHAGAGLFDDFINLLGKRVFHVHLGRESSGIDFGYVASRLKVLKSSPVVILELRDNKYVIDGFKWLESLMA